MAKADATTHRVLARLEAIEAQRAAHAERCAEAERKRKADLARKKLTRVSWVVKQMKALEVGVSKHQPQAKNEQQHSSIGTASRVILRLNELKAEAQRRIQQERAWKARGRPTSAEEVNPQVEKVLAGFVKRHSDRPLHETGSMMRAATAEALEGARLTPSTDPAFVLAPEFERRARSLLTSMAVEPREAKRSSYLRTAQLRERKCQARARLRLAGNVSIFTALVARQKAKANQAAQALKSVPSEIEEPLAARTRTSFVPDVEGGGSNCEAPAQGPPITVPLKWQSGGSKGSRNALDRPCSSRALSRSQAPGAILQPTPPSLPASTRTHRPRVPKSVWLPASP